MRVGSPVIPGLNKLAVKVFEVTLTLTLTLNFLGVTLSDLSYISMLRKMYVTENTVLLLFSAIYSLQNHIEFLY